MIPRSVAPAAGRRLALLVLLLIAAGGVEFCRTGHGEDDSGPKAPAPLAPFKLPAGFTAELAAGPPLVEYPMHACFDDRGRLYVADSLGINPKGEQLSKKPTQVIRLLEDTDGDGKFDKSTIFADQLVFPEGVLWHDGVVYTASPPSLWRLEDTDGDGKADKRQELVTGFPNTGIADDLHGPSVGPDGRIYWSCGRFKHEIRRPGGPVLWKGRAPGVLRCRPDGSGLEFYSGAQGNPVKQAFSPEGEPFTCGTWSKGQGGRQDVVTHSIEGGNYPNLDGDFFSPEFKHTPDILPPLVWFGPASASGICRYRSEAFGAEYRNNLFAALFNTHKVVRLIVERDGATYRARPEDFLTSENKDFRPADVIEDADGSLLVINTGTWSNCCEAFRAGGQPKATGGIWRIRRQGAPAVKDPWGTEIKWAGLTPRHLLWFLDDPRFAVRDRAVRALAKDATVKSYLPAFHAARQPVRARRNLIWAMAQRGGDEALGVIRPYLLDKDASLRLTACTALGLLRDKGSLPELIKLLRDDSPAVRREAATGLGRLGSGQAVAPLFDALRAGGDRFLEHALLYALIRIGDRGATLKGLGDPSPQVRRGAVIALDQMDNGNLTQDQVTPLLNTDDPGLQKTALAIISTRPGWAKETIGLLGRWLQEKEVPADRQDSLRGALLAFCKDPAIQQLVTQTLQQEQTPAGTRLLLLETMARAPLNQLPAAWVEQLGKGLQHADERVVRQAVATIRAGRAGQFDDVLVGLAQDNTRPAELRVAALTAAAPRLTKLDQALFSYLLGRLDKELGPLARLDAASCLGQARLNEGQLESLTQAIAAASPLEMPHLVGPFERCKNAGVGLKLLAALDKSPGLTSLAPDELRRILQGYPAEVREAAAPLLKKLEVDGEKIKARVAELEPGLTGGDAKRGREVFYGKKAACFTCHTVKGDGGQVGPDLSTIGAIRSERDLLVALAFPSAGFTRGFEPYVVGTRDGKVFPAGILRRETADAVYLVTGDRAEVRVPRTEIDVFEPGKVSIMPQGLDVQLGKQELADLMAFLRSLR